MNRFHLFVILLAAIAVPFAAADTIQLSNNNLGISGSVGTVTLTQQSGGVLVSFQAAAGYSLKTNGGDLLFDTNVALTAGSISNVKVDGQYSPNFGFTVGATRAGVNYSYDITNLMKGTLPKSYVSANTISFFVSGVTLKQLETGSFGVHFCVGGGTKCGPSTGFANGHGGSPVPEPGTLSLLGTGLVGLAGMLRRRYIA